MGPRFEIIGSIAKGGMAEVFRARTVGADGYGKVVAIKRMASSLLDDPQAVRMLKDEARLALLLSHPNIVQVFDFGLDDDGYFLMMELVDGPDFAHLLREHYRRRQILPEACSVAIAIDVLRALDYAHRRADEQGHPLHVVHRDVSPSNILISGEGVVKLGDFGIAKAKGRLQTTAVGAIKGKMPYMAPEQVLAGNVDARSDLFSLGLVMWEALAGGRCYEPLDDAELFRRVSKGAVRTFGQVRAPVPAELEEIVMRALEAEPARRFQSAAIMAHSLERYHRRAHPDFGIEHLAALLGGTLPTIKFTGVDDELTPLSVSRPRLEGPETDDEEVPPDMAKTKPPRPR